MIVVNQENKILTCPHCGEQAISPLDKLLLGPVISARCNHCRKRISVSWSSAWLIVPAVTFISVLRFFISSFSVSVVCTVLIVVLALFLYVKWIPLVRR